MKKLIINLLLLVIWISSVWALFHSGFFRVHDYTHGARISEMTRALEDGHFPVRWTENFGYGYGMPLFEFYAPLPYYVGSLFYWVSQNMILTLKFLFGICSLVTMIGGFRLGKKLFGETSGVLVAASLTLAPYRAVNLFVRGALSEAWAIMFLPWILLGLIKVINKEKKGWITLVMSLVGLMLSHNITTMIFIPTSLLFAGLYFLSLVLKRSKPFWKKNKLNLKNIMSVFLQLIGSFSLAVGISSFYLFPAFIEKDYTKVTESILGAYFNFRLHFLYIRQFFQPNWGYGGSAWGVDDNVSYFLGWGQIAGLFIAIFLILVNIYLFFSKKSFISKKSKNNQRKSTLFLSFSLLLLTGFTLFMSILKSKFIWEVLPLIEFVQFPWRWLSVSIVFVSLLVGLSLYLIENNKLQKKVSLLLLVVIILGNVGYFKPEKFTDNPSDFYYSDPKLIRTNMSDILQDYIPSQMPELGEIEPIHKLVLNEGLEDQYNVIFNKGHEKLISTNFSDPQLLDIGIADYPGWTVEMDGRDHKSFDRDVKLTSDFGNIQIAVQPGPHTIGLKFSGTNLRNITDYVSAISFLIFLYLIMQNSYNIDFIKNLQKKDKDND